MRILVTGGAGFIGANLVAELLRLGHTVKVLDNFSTGRRSNLPALDDVELIEGDLRSYERVHRAVQRCEVFHQGALPSVPRSVVDPLTSNEINIGGTLKIVDDLVREFPDRVEAITRLSPPEVAALLDDSIALALSSESEGLPRVIMEAFARGRAVVATSVGGIPDIVEADRNGFLVHRGDAPALADALVRILRDRELAERLGREARETARDLEGAPERYAAWVRRLVEQVLSEP